MTSERKNNIKCFRKVFTHHVSQEYLQRSLALIFQVSGKLLEGWKTIPPKTIPSFGVLENASDCNVPSIRLRSADCEGAVDGPAAILDKRNLIIARKDFSYKKIR